MRRFWQNLVLGWATNPSVAMTATEAMNACDTVGRGYQRDAATVRLLNEGYIEAAGMGDDMTPRFRLTMKGVDWIAAGMPVMDPPRSRKRGHAPRPGDATLEMARIYAARSVFDLARVHTVTG